MNAFPLTKLPVGIPRERKVGERRVGLTPKGATYLVECGVPVFVESGAGALSGFDNASYLKAGAQVLPEGAAVWNYASVIKKVKEPLAEEFGFLNERHILFAFLHLASPSSRPLIDALLKAKATAIGYETVEWNGETPLLRPLSEIAGTLAAYDAWIFRETISVEKNKIRGIEEAKRRMEEWANRYPACPRGTQKGARVLVLGSGIVGTRAAQMSARMGCEVVVTEVDPNRRRERAELFRKEGLAISLVDPAEGNSYREAFRVSGAIVSAVHRAGRQAPLVIDQNLLKEISASGRKIIIDIAIDQGGNVAESWPTTYDEPLYLDSFGNVRFSVANVPSLCGRQAAEALETASLEMTLALAGGVDSAVKKFPELRNGINTRGGFLVHEGIRDAHGL